MLVKHADIYKYLETPYMLLNLHCCEENTGLKYVRKEYSSIEEVIKACKERNPKATRMHEWKRERIKQLGIYLEKLINNTSDEMICINA